MNEFAYDYILESLNWSASLPTAIVWIWFQAWLNDFEQRKLGTDFDSQTGQHNRTAQLLGSL